MGVLKNKNHEKFALLVADGMSQYDAVKEIYPSTKKWSDNAIYVRGTRLVQQPKIKLRIDELNKKYDNKLNEQFEITAKKVIEEMAKWLMVDPADVFDEDNTIGSIRDLPKEVRMSISGFKVSALYEGAGKDRKRVGDIYDIKFVDKRATADMFMKKFGEYVDSKVTLETDLEHLSEVVTGIKGLKGKLTITKGISNE